MVTALQSRHQQLHRDYMLYFANMCGWLYLWESVCPNYGGERGLYWQRLLNSEGKWLVCGQLHIWSVVKSIFGVWSTTHLVCGQQDIWSVVNNTVGLWSTAHLVCGQQHIWSVVNITFGLWSTIHLVCGQQHIWSVVNNTFGLWSNWVYIGDFERDIYTQSAYVYHQWTM